MGGTQEIPLNLTILTPPPFLTTSTISSQAFIKTEAALMGLDPQPQGGSQPRDDQGWAHGLASGFQTRLREE